MLRASDADRERIVENLRRSWCEGYLSYETFGERVERAYRARSRGELRRLVSDLPLGPLAALLPLWERLRWAFGRERFERGDQALELELPLVHGRSASLVLGRAADCGYRLLDDTVSRHHAKVECEGGVWVISDLDSTNGVYVNGRRIWRAALHPGDDIALGSSSLQVVGYPLPGEIHAGLSDASALA